MKIEKLKSRCRKIITGSSHAGEYGIDDEFHFDFDNNVSMSLRLHVRAESSKIANDKIINVIESIDEGFVSDLVKSVQEI